MLESDIQRARRQLASTEPMSDEPDIVTLEEDDDDVMTVRFSIQGIVERFTMARVENWGFLCIYCFNYEYTLK